MLKVDKQYNNHNINDWIDLKGEKVKGIFKEKHVEGGSRLHIVFESGFSLWVKADLINTYGIKSPAELKASIIAKGIKDLDYKRHELELIASLVEGNEVA